MAPMLSVALLLAALAIAPVMGGGMGEVASGVLLILVLTSVAIRLLWSGCDGSWSRVPGWWFLVAFAVLAVLSALFSRSVYFSLNQMLALAACLAGFLLAASVCRDDRTAAAALWVLVLSALYVSGGGVRGYILDAGGGIGFWKALTSSGAHARLFGPFVNPNFFSGYLVIALPVTLALFLAIRKTLLAILPAAAFVFEVMALMLTGAKFGVAAAAVALVVFLLLTALTRSLERRSLVKLLLLALVAGTVLIPFSMPVKSRVEEAQAGGTQVHSAAFRLYTWKATLNMIQAQPVLGVGPGVFPITYPQYTVAGPTRHAHNSYLQIASEMGVPALLAFVVLLPAIAWKCLRGLFRCRDADPPSQLHTDSITWSDFVPSGGWRLVSCGLFAALVGSSIRSLVDSDWYIIGIALTFWVAAGLLAARTCPEERRVVPAGASRVALAAACVALIAISASFAVGERFASAARDAARADDRTETGALWRGAAAWSPLHPEYRRQRGLWLGLDEGDFRAAEAEIERSISLARNTSEGGWKAMGMLAIARRNWPQAISNLNTAARYNPNSTDTLSLLAAAYHGLGDTEGYEAVLRRMLAIEKSPYEQIRGTPELVDTTYAYAHAYFGKKELARKRYAAAVREFEAAVDRLELWRASGDMRQLQQMMGMSNEVEDERRLDLLRECYKGLIDANYALGNEAEVDEALKKIQDVK